MAIMNVHRKFGELRPFPGMRADRQTNRHTHCNILGSPSEGEVASSLVCVIELTCGYSIKVKNVEAPFVK